MRKIKKTIEQENTFKKIKCFNDLIQGIEHCNGTSQHANFYNKIDKNTVSIQHFYRHGKTQKPFIMTKIEFDKWLKAV